MKGFFVGRSVKLPRIQIRAVRIERVSPENFSHLNRYRCLEHFQLLSGAIA